MEAYKAVSVNLAEGFHESRHSKYSYEKLFCEDSVDLGCVFSQEMFRDIPENRDL